MVEHYFTLSNITDITLTPVKNIELTKSITSYEEAVKHIEEIYIDRLKISLTKE